MILSKEGVRVGSGSAHGDGIGDEFDVGAIGDDLKTGHAAVEGGAFGEVFEVAVLFQGLAEILQGLKGEWGGIGSGERIIGNVQGLTIVL